MVTDHRLEKYCGLRAGTAQTLSIESVFLSNLVGVAQGPIGSSRSNRPVAYLGFPAPGHKITVVSAPPPTPFVAVWMRRVSWE